MVHGALLAVHVVAGTVGLLLGPVVMWADTRWLRAGEPPGRGGPAYVATVLVVALTAIGLVAVRRADLWWLVPVSVLTLALAVAGRRALARPGRGRLHLYVHGQAGSYIALVTATVVVSLAIDGPLTGAAQLVAWLGPTAVGTVLLELWRRRLVRAGEDLTPGRTAPGRSSATASR